MRSLHGPARRPAGQLVLVPRAAGGWPLSADRRRSGLAWSTASVAVSFPGGGRSSVRLLHAGDVDERKGAAGPKSESERGRDQAVPRRQPVSLHRLRGHHPGGRQGRDDARVARLTPQLAGYRLGNLWTVVPSRGTEAAVPGDEP